VGRTVVSVAGDYTCEITLNLYLDTVGWLVGFETFYASHYQSLVPSVIRLYSLRGWLIGRHRQRFELVSATPLTTLLGLGLQSWKTERESRTCWDGAMKPLHMQASLVPREASASLHEVCHAANARDDGKPLGNVDQSP